MLTTTEYVTVLYNNCTLTKRQLIDLTIGFDISTAVTGICITTVTNEIVMLGFIDTRKIEHFWDVVDKIAKGIHEIANAYKIAKVFVEEDLKKFRSGFSSATTIATLGKINGIVSYIAKCAFSIEPLYVKSSLARTICGVKILKAKTKIDKKDQWWVKRQVYNHMLIINPLLSTLHWQSTRPTIKNPHGRLRDECFDMIDAYVVAYAGNIGNIATRI